MMTDASKAVVWRATYLPFGEPYTIIGSATIDQRFPGQWFQLESGLHYNWNRHYDPSIGRYLQPDPLGMPDGPSRWAYVNNSPLMYTDPTGEFRLSPPGGWGRPLAHLPPFKLPPMSPEFMWPTPPTPNACTAPLGGVPDFGGPLFSSGGGDKETPYQAKLPKTNQCNLLEKRRKIPIMAQFGRKIMLDMVVVPGNAGRILKTGSGKETESPFDRTAV